MTSTAHVETWQTVKHTPAPFANPAFHQAMLRNRSKYARFAEAFRGSVAGTRVLDVGCGSGILALLAARFGATTVTAVERSAVSSLTTCVFAAFPDLAANITLIQDDFFNLQPDFYYDVIVSETVGYFGFEENIWALLARAADEWSHPSTQFFPRSLSMEPQLVSIGNEAGGPLSLSHATWSRLTIDLIKSPSSVDLSEPVPPEIQLKWAWRTRERTQFDGIVLSVEAMLGSGDLCIGNRDPRFWPRSVVRLPWMQTVDCNDEIQIEFRCRPHAPSCAVQFLVSVNDRLATNTEFLSHELGWSVPTTGSMEPNSTEDVISAVREVLHAAR